jgi:hypothetical protein
MLESNFNQIFNAKLIKCETKHAEYRVSSTALHCFLILVWIFSVYLYRSSMPLFAHRKQRFRVKIISKRCAHILFHHGRQEVVVGLALVDLGMQQRCSPVQGVHRGYTVSSFCSQTFRQLHGANKPLMNRFTMFLGSPEWSIWPSKSSSSPFGELCTSISDSNAALCPSGCLAIARRKAESRSKDATRRPSILLVCCDAPRRWLSHV